MHSLKHISALILALLVSVNALGMPLHKHYCMGRLKVVTFDESKSTCKMMEMQCSLHDEAEKMPCCETETELISLDDAKVQPIETIAFSKVQVAFLNVFLFAQAFPNAELNTHNYLSESPPYHPIFLFISGCSLS